MRWSLRVSPHMPLNSFSSTVARTSDEDLGAEIHTFFYQWSKKIHLFFEPLRHNFHFWHPQVLISRIIPKPTKKAGTEIEMSEVCSKETREGVKSQKCWIIYPRILGHRQLVFSWGKKGMEIWFFEKLPMNWENRLNGYVPAWLQLLDMDDVRETVRLDESEKSQSDRR